MKLEVVPYDSEWPVKFSRLRSRLESAIPFPGCSIQHIGSTAVPGLAAKPIIDILIGVVKESELDVLPKALTGISEIHYVPYWENVMPFRRFFIWADASMVDPAIPSVIHDRSWNDIHHQARLAHIHATTTTHSFYKEHIAFRDLLINDDAIRQEYENLKLELAAKEWESGADYAGAKASFIRQALDRSK